MPDRTAPSSSPTRRPMPLSARVILRVVFYTLFIGLVLFGASGKLGWYPARIFLGFQLLGTTINATLTLKRNPGLIEERLSVKPDVKRWDKLLMPVMAWGGLFSILLASLEQRLAPGGPDPTILSAAGWAALASGYALASWAMASNPFFSALVRIQQDRGHRVVCRGPYRWERHPGYLGAIFVNLALPVIFSSRWALVPAGLTVLASLARTVLEDRTLHRELPGYAAYASRIRWRLLPAVW